jgi:hypothetical protein
LAGAVPEEANQSVFLMAIHVVNGLMEARLLSPNRVQGKAGRQWSGLAYANTKVEEVGEAKLQELTGAGP